MSWWCGGIFLTLSLVLAGISTRNSGTRSVLEGQIESPVPVTAPAIPVVPDLNAGAASDTN